jgi:hypothetical protein
MSLLTPWALGGLAVLVPLVILHLRHDRRHSHEVPSLRLWLDLEPVSARRRAWVKLPRLPLLLALQVLAVTLIVGALARPAAPRTAGERRTVYVIDGSFWMSAAGRIPAAVARVSALAARLPAAAKVSVVLADGSPRLLYSGDPAGVRKALQRVRPGIAPSTLSGALALAARESGGGDLRFVVMRAPEDPAPAVRAGGAQLQVISVGPQISDQGIFPAGARCAGASARDCEVLAVVANHSPRSVTDSFTAYDDGARTLSSTVNVAPESDADLTLASRPNQQIALRLNGHDALAEDNEAWITVPGPANASGPLTVTLVGEPSDAQVVAQAFAAVPGVHLRLRTPRSYRATDARASGLTVLDGWLPRSGLPASASVLLINPPRIPGGRVGGPLSDTVVSGTDVASALLDGVDLTSLSIDPDSAHRVILPGYMSALAWSPGGPLVAAGEDGVRRVALLTFDPSRSDLPQLSALPLLAENLASWAADWSPATTPAGEPFDVDVVPGARRLMLGLAAHPLDTISLSGAPQSLTLNRPGLYSLTETGPHLSRTATVAVDVGAPITSRSATADLTGLQGSPAVDNYDAAPWLLAIALLVLILEWGYWLRLRRGVVGL